MRFVATGICFVNLAILSSCVASPTNIDRSFTAQAVQAHSTSSTAILNALSADAGFGKKSVTFYEITEAGFNFVDDQCNGYFQALQDLDARRNATKQTLSAFGQTSNAILAVTGANALSMAVTAQAFGLGQNLTDVYANSFLFSLPPARTQQFVSKVMVAYKNAAAENHAQINNWPSAYREIRDYLHLCMPVTIEAMLSDHIADTTAEAVIGPGSTNIVTGSRTSAQQKAIIDATGPIANPDTQLPKHEQKRAGSNTPGAINPDEGNIRSKLLKQIQDMVCVESSGAWDAKTREAIANLFNALGYPRPRITTEGFSRNDLPLLQRGLGPPPLKCGKGAKNRWNIQYENVDQLAKILS